MWSASILLALILLLAACGDDATGSDASVDGSAGDVGAGADATPGDATVDASRDTGPLPEGLISIDDLAYAGAFRIASQMYGASTPDYATGTLG